MSEYKLIHADVFEALSTLESNSVDAVVSDPPYELNFMSKSWDNTGIANNPKMWSEVFRVLKPGGHLLSFGGSRTYHRMASAVEDAGFEIRDQIMWVYGSGFPKSMDVSKAIDKAAGAARECTREGVVQRGGLGEDWDTGSSQTRPRFDNPVTVEAQQWEGWGTALKPAHEPIVLARKPLGEKTVVNNVLTHGTGALNIGAGRIPGEPVPINKLEKWSGFGEEKQPDYTPTVNDQGRWPANLIHDGSDEVLAEFDKAGVRTLGKPTLGKSPTTKNDYGVYANRSLVDGGDSGSAARFFYCAKTSKTDRNDGCEELTPKTAGESTDRKDDSAGLNSPRAGDGRTSGSLNHHPTVKPTELMRYLVRLITPPGGTVLDPFMGSGSTGKAAVLEGFRFIGIEREAEYVEIAQARIQKVANSVIVWRSY